MGLTIRQASFLVMPMPQERFLTLGAHKMLNVPMFAQRRYNAFLDWPTTRTTNRYTHSIVAFQAIQLVHIVFSVAGPVFYFACRRIQFDTTSGAVEVVAVIDFAPKT